MGRAKKPPVTAAIRVLRANDVEYTPHLYDYVPQGGAQASSSALEVPLHQVVKTLIFEDEAASPFVVLMHGDARVNTGELARQLEVKRVMPCAPEVAQKHSGYLVGGTSPFGTKRTMPIYIEESILSLPWILINGGKRGFLVQLAPSDISRVLSPDVVTVGLYDHDFSNT